MTSVTIVNPFSNFTIESYRNSYSNNYTHSSSQLDFTITDPSIDIRPISANILRGINTSLCTDSLPWDKSRVVARGEMGAEQAMLGPLILSGNDLISDFSSHIRKGFDASHFLYGTENPIALSALGFTTGFSLISGGLNVCEGLEEIGKTKKIADVTGRSLACLRVAKGSAQFFGASFMVPMRALTIAALITASKTYMTFAGVLGSLGGVCFNALSFIVGVSLGIRLFEHYQFRSGLNLILNDPSLSEEAQYTHALEHLRKLATVSPAEREEIRLAITSNAKYSALTADQIAEKVVKKERKLLEKKAAHLKRVTSDTCLNQICQNRPSEAKAVIDAVKKKNLEKVILTTIALSLVILACATTIGSFLLLPGAPIIAAVIGLATSFCWTGMDAYSLFNNLNSGDPGRFDKLLILLSTTIAVSAVAVVFFLSGGIAPIIAASVVGAVWLGTNIVCYYRIHQFEKATEPVIDLDHA